MILDRSERANLNALLGSSSPLSGIEKVARMFPGRMIMTTSGGQHSAALPNMVSRVISSRVPLVFIDTRHYTQPTYDMIDYFREQGYDVKIYASRYSQEEIEQQYPGWWDENDPAFSQKIFDTVVKKIKHEPLERAIEELTPDVWVSGLTSFKSAARETKNVIEYNELEILKIYPIIHWDLQEVENYLRWHGLPSNPHHFDITKGLDQRNECGIHTALGE
ncbi:MAG: phosphoadenosine phosphosulfate reductase family protein [Pseudomonadales bacterium]